MRCRGLHWHRQTELVSAGWGYSAKGIRSQGSQSYTVHMRPEAGSWGGSRGSRSAGWRWSWTSEWSADNPGSTAGPWRSRAGVTFLSSMPTSPGQIFYPKNLTTERRNSHFSPSLKRCWSRSHWRTGWACWSMCRGSGGDEDTVDVDDDEPDL